MYSEFTPSQPLLPFLDLYLTRRSSLELAFAYPKHINPSDDMDAAQELTTGESCISDGDATVQEKVESQRKQCTPTPLNADCPSQITSIPGGKRLG